MGPGLLMGIFTPLQTMKYMTLNDHFIGRGMKYFEVEVINTNGNTWTEYIKENEYLQENTMNTRLSTWLKKVFLRIWKYMMYDISEKYDDGIVTYPSLKFPLIWFLTNAKKNHNFLFYICRG